MAISCWDRFTAIEWTRYACISARLTLVILVITAVITWFTYKDYEDKYNNSKDAVIGVSVYAVVVAFFMLIAETPVFHCFGAIKIAKDHWLMSPFAKGTYYFCLSILTFVYISPIIAGGAFLVLTSIFEYMVNEHNTPIVPSHFSSAQSLSSRRSVRSLKMLPTRYMALCRPCECDVVVH